MKIMITGANGQLGQELQQLLDEMELEYFGCDSDEMDITDSSKVSAVFNEVQPTIVFHCAAYTAVDNAEDDGKELNYKVNVLGTENIAKACKKRQAKMVYISTDYVFNGKNENEYLTSDTPDPINEYGKAKLKGEEMVQKHLSMYYIVRTSWVFGQYGKNFVYTMLKLSETKSELAVINNQYGRPTWTRTLAEFMIYLIEKEVPYGIYHLSNDGECSWYEFSKEILKDKEITIDPVTSEEYPQKAQRPQHSILSLEKTKKTGFEIPTWQQALASFKTIIENKS
ncbi:dTDP-4-dehydrorhamnose reductase [Lacticigenium naphthae]|uniref:dTDP-4-dehydrorhamnose reductase n=1 Tax=Lacticigenium naphthae TaxID=515351 RepID=UPI00041FA6EA|nr:dTDP-4-dehydrorhamnose reductase [Lacticigenium naphthae]